MFDIHCSFSGLRFVSFIINEHNGDDDDSHKTRNDWAGLPYGAETMTMR